MAPSGNCCSGIGSACNRFLAAFEPLPVQHRVDLARENVADAIALFPRGAKPVGIVAAAEEARPMPRRERGRLIEKEQLGPAAAAHHLAPPSPEFAERK